MNSFIHKFSIMSDRQFGFVQGRGTTALLEEFADELCKSFEHNLFCCALFLDVSKAFDTVCHDILLRKLYLIGFRGPFQAVLKNYLADRSQMVVIGNTYSSTKLPLDAGVPQGSILSPLLFNLFVNDFVSIIPNGVVFQYADDIVLLTKHVNINRQLSNYSNQCTKLCLGSRKTTSPSIMTRLKPCVSKIP